MRVINRLFVHCAATVEGRWYDADDIDRWHRERGWRGNGYHNVILLDGTVQDGRPIEERGAHAAGHNHDSIGICYIGGVDHARKPKDTRTPEQRAMIHYLIAYYRDRVGSHITIHGHNEVAAKACPSYNVAEDLKRRERLMEELKVRPPHHFPRELQSPPGRVSR